MLTASDDMTIKLWDWEKGWKCVQVYEGHNHYVMGLSINPKDTNTFASACLDRTVKIWSLGSPHANFTLEAHETKGVNHVDYYPQADKPYLLTTSDDKTVKVWDYTTKALIATLEGHTSNVSFACYHPELPVIIAGWCEVELEPGMFLQPGFHLWCFMSRAVVQNQMKILFFRCFSINLSQKVEKFFGAVALCDAPNHLAV